MEGGKEGRRKERKGSDEEEAKIGNEKGGGKKGGQCLWSRGKTVQGYTTIRG